VLDFIESRSLLGQAPDVIVWNIRQNGCVVAVPFCFKVQMQTASRRTLRERGLLLGKQVHTVFHFASVVCCVVPELLDVNVFFMDLVFRPDSFVWRSGSRTLE